MEKKYLKWYNKVGYGIGDLGGNMIIGTISSFILIYLTDTMGMNAGIIGSLMLVSKVLDGISDIIFGALIDKTHTKMGKARPWMLGSMFGMAICMVMLFAVPNTSSTAQYVYFFITYTIMNAVFYTASCISYTTLTSLITRNGEERVQIGSYKFISTQASNLLTSILTVRLVPALGGGAAGWRNVAIIYAVWGIVINAVCVFSVKELPEEEQTGDMDEKAETRESLSMVEALKYLVSCKYFWMLLGINLFLMMGLVVGGGVGIFYATYQLNDPNMLGTLQSANTIATIISLFLTPLWIKLCKSVWRGVSLAMAVSVIAHIVFAAAGYMGNIPLMMAGMFVKSLGLGPVMGGTPALIAETSTYLLKKKNVRIEAPLYSCTSLGNKIGLGITSALTGWLLALGGYDGTAAVQSASALNMINFMYLILPTVFILCVMLCVVFLNVEKENKKMDEIRTA